MKETRSIFEWWKGPTVNGQHVCAISYSFSPSLTPATAAETISKRALTSPAQSLVSGLYYIPLSLALGSSV